jgi:hypothetical protein
MCLFLADDMNDKISQGHGELPHPRPAFVWAGDSVESWAAVS